jgi:tRNA(Arg) A34 adenosine deaminase TadA
MTDVPAGFEVHVPEWLAAQSSRLLEPSASDDEIMHLLNRLAARNVREGTGGPFAAAVVDDESREIVAVGVNLVLSSNLSFAHAEMVALSLAQARLGVWNLRSDKRSRTLMVNAQPCAMCTGAVVWSGVTALDFSAARADVERLTGFDEGPVSVDWQEQLEARGISVSSGRCVAESLDVLRDFGERAREGSITLYNG